MSAGAGPVAIGADIVAVIVCMALAYTVHAMMIAHAYAVHAMMIAHAYTVQSHQHEVAKMALSRHCITNGSSFEYSMMCFASLSFSPSTCCHYRYRGVVLRAMPMLTHTGHAHVHVVVIIVMALGINMLLLS